MTGSVESSYYYDYFGTVYSAEGEILDSFAFTAPVFITSRDLSFTQDGKKMLCGSSVFDLQTHELMDLETAVPEGIIPVHFQSSVTQNAIFSALWDDGSLYLYENGREKEKIHFDGEFRAADMRKKTEYEKAFDFDPILAGQSRLYLYNSDSLMTGVCIDSESWEPLFEIPSMCCALSNDTLITNECIPGGLEYLQYPLYTLEDMIGMGKELLGE